MKKTLLLLTLIVGTIFGASAQCTPDTTNFGAGVYVYPVSLPCITRSQAYTNTQTLKVPDSLGYDVAGTTYYGHIDSIQIDSITGYPAGITSVSNPALGPTWLKPGGYACTTFSGTTTANSGDYILTISGNACGHITLPVVGLVDTCLYYAYTKTFPDTLKICGNVGVVDVSGNLNLNIYPNPNQGNFTVTVSSATHVNGTMSVLDQLGRVINTQSLDVEGTKQIPLELGNIAAGAYILEINADGARSVKQFIVK